ncbi:hypothetical protein IDH08_00165 [Pelagibacterales bacterium SAG-MED22]|nr:hypothetical protein [Pelagibacterales bacterium SAG-MED22]
MKFIKKSSKIIFYFANLFLIIAYVYPGNFIGCYLYNNCDFEPQIINNFFISINHFFAFSFLTALGLFAFDNISELKVLKFYLLFIAVFLELLHFLIPIRAFQFSDLLGNVLGITVIIILYFFKYEFYKK